MTSSPGSGAQTPDQPTDTPGAHPAPVDSPAHGPAAPRPAAPGSGTPGPGRAARALVGLPSRLGVLFFWTTLVVALTVITGQFHPWLVLAVLGLVVAATWRLVPAPVPATREAVRGSAAALGLAAVWVAVNLPWASEVLLVQRDPGFLTLQGLWLVDHADPAVPVRSAAEVAAAVPGLGLTSDAFALVGNELLAQGAKTFPGLIAMLGWVAGTPGVLAANLLIGGLALLAVYDVARRLTTPGWALLPMAALALSTPMLYFSRTPFTEPTNIVLTFAGLAVLWSAFADGRAWRYPLAGAMIGASALSRIDGAAVVAGLVVGLGVIAAGTADRDARRARVRGMYLVVASAAAMVVLGYLDLRWNSPVYLEEHATLYVQLIGLLMASLLGALVLERVTRVPRVAAWLTAHVRGLATAGAVGVVVIALVLASRPLWMQAHWFAGRENYMAFIAAFQQAAGVPVDGSRSYDEMTLVWLSWYLGPLTVVLAVLGAALMLRRGVVARRPELLVVLGTLGVPTLLYVWQPSITPDQIWAMRRFLPAAIPAALLCAGWLLHAAWGAASAAWQRVLAGALVVATLLAPLATWQGLVRAVEYGGRADEIADVCAAVRGARVVVVRDSGPPLLPTVRIACGVDVVEVGRGSAAQLAAVREAWDGERVVVVSTSGDAIPWAQGARPANAWRAATLTRWPHTLYPANNHIRFRSLMWLGEVGADGTVTPLDPAGA